MRLPLISRARRVFSDLLDRREQRLEEEGIPPKPLGLDLPYWALRHSPLMAALSDDACEGIAGRLRTLTLSRREEATIDPSAGVWLVARGGLKIMRYADDGRALLSWLVDPGGVIGPFSGVESPTVDVVAIEDTTAYQLERDAFSQLLTSQPDLCLGVVQELDRRNRRLERRMESLIFKSVEARTIEALLEFSKTYGEPCSHGMALDIRLSQQDGRDDREPFSSRRTLRAPCSWPPPSDLEHRCLKFVPSAALRMSA